MDFGRGGSGRGEEEARARVGPGGGGARRGHGGGDPVEGDHVLRAQRRRQDAHRRRVGRPGRVRARNHHLRRARPARTHGPPLSRIAGPRRQRPPSGARAGVHLARNRRRHRAWPIPARPRRPPCTRLLRETWGCPVSRTGPCSASAASARPRAPSRPPAATARPPGICPPSARPAPARVTKPEPAPASPESPTYWQG